MTRRPIAITVSAEQTGIINHSFSNAQAWLSDMHVDTVPDSNRTIQNVNKKSWSVEM